jgi:hypothetical protein
MLHAIRVRGTTESTTKAMKMLAELKGASPAAAAEVSAAVPPPPPIEEVFSGVRFGVPDWDSGRRILASAPVDQARFVKDLDAKIPPVPVAADAAATGGDQPALQSANQSAAISQLLKDIFHVEVGPTTETRDLAIRRAAASTPDAGSGSLDIEGADKQIPVLYEGRVLFLPAKLSLQAGKYEIRSVQDGKVVSTQEVEIQAGSPQKITVKR